MGFAANVEFGPGRHGPGHALFVYLRDPDGHRIELFNTHYQVMDIENEPVRWDVSHSGKRRWQLPARRQWYTEASRFAGVEPREPARQGRSDDAGEIHRRRHAIVDRGDRARAGSLACGEEVQVSSRAMPSNPPRRKGVRRPSSTGYAGEGTHRHCFA